MTVRILRGTRADGSKGFDVSKPGFDVRTADLMHMAFSSDLKIPKVVIAGQATINPTNGFKAKDFNLPGGQATVITFPFGQTFAQMPVGIVVGKCANWNIPLVPLSNRTICPGLWNKTITPIYENFTVNGDLTYGTNVNRWVVGSSGDANTVSDQWGACAFLVGISYSAMTIRFNGSSPMLLKYLVLRYF